VTEELGTYTYRHSRVAYQLTQWAWQHYGTVGREPDLPAHRHLVRRAAQIGLPAQRIAEAIAAGVWPTAARDGAAERSDRLRATILALTAA
jgi:hypothetical protein